MKLIFLQNIFFLLCQMANESAPPSCALCVSYLFSIPSLKHPFNFSLFIPGFAWGQEAPAIHESETLINFGPVLKSCVFFVKSFKTEWHCFLDCSTDKPLLGLSWHVEKNITTAHKSAFPGLSHCLELLFPIIGQLLACLLHVSPELAAAAVLLALKVTRVNRKLIHGRRCWVKGHYPRSFVKPRLLVCYSPAAIFSFASIQGKNDFS